MRWQELVTGRTCKEKSTYEVKNSLGVPVKNLRLSLRRLADSNS